jgi:hypothetical protein
MNSTEFIKEIINNLVELFPSIKCTYQYDASSYTHFIEVVPNKVYHSEKEYANEETKATLAFIDKYPHESICFITDDSIIKLDNPIYVKAGDLFSNNIPTSATPDAFSFISEMFNWETPFHVASTQNSSLYELLTSFDNKISQSNKKGSTLKAPPIAPPVIISDEVENELPLAA